MIRLMVPSIEDDDIEAVRTSLASGMLVQGARVAAFEAELAAFLGVPHAIAVTNCTAALHLALLALNVGPGDAVAVPAYSWIATANVIELVGAKPVFVDIDPRTFNMSPPALADELERLRREKDVRLKAILPVHAFGQLADVQALLRIAADHHVPIVEDAACALGASFSTRGILQCFSFHPRKAITTGEGGVVATTDDRLARMLRMLRNHGIDPDEQHITFAVPGLNCRMTEFQAAMGLTQLRKLPRILRRRRELADVYKSALANTTITPPFDNGTHTYQTFVCLLPPDRAASRSQVIANMRECGVEATIGTWHMPLARYFRMKYGYKPGDFPTTDDVFARSISLPLHERLTRDEQSRVIEVLLAQIR